MPREEYKPKDKVVMRMTREGAVEENLTEGTSERISTHTATCKECKHYDKNKNRGIYGENTVGAAARTQ